MRNSLRRLVGAMLGLATLVSGSRCFEGIRLVAGDFSWAWQGDVTRFSCEINYSFEDSL